MTKSFEKSQSKLSWLHWPWRFALGSECLHVHSQDLEPWLGDDAWVMVEDGASRPSWSCGMRCSMLTTSVLLMGSLRGWSGCCRFWQVRMWNDQSPNQSCEMWRLCKGWRTPKLEEICSDHVWSRHELNWMFCCGFDWRYCFFQTFVFRDAVSICDSRGYHWICCIYYYFNLFQKFQLNGRNHQWTCKRLIAFLRFHESEPFIGQYLWPDEAFLAFKLPETCRPRCAAEETGNRKQLQFQLRTAFSFVKTPLKKLQKYWGNVTCPNEASRCCMRVQYPHQRRSSLEI